MLAADDTSLADAFASLAPEDRAEFIATLSEREAEEIKFHWPIWARPDQMPPDSAWRTWLLLGGRGSGKTRSSAEWVRSQIQSGRRRSIGIIGPTSDTLRRDVVQGPSGLLEVSPPWFKPNYQPSQRRIVWPNGAVALLFSSEEPERIRGPNLDGFWGDEMTSWKYPEACWDNLQFALRIKGPKGESIEFDLPNGMHVVFGPPAGMSLSYRIITLMGGADTGIAHQRILRALLCVRSIDGAPTAVNNEIEANALANRVGDGGIELLNFYLNEYWPPIRRAELPALKKNQRV